MRIFLFCLAILALLAGTGIFAAAKSAIHEIEAFVLFLIAAVLLSGAAIVETINLLRKDITLNNELSQKENKHTVSIQKTT